MERRRLLIGLGLSALAAPRNWDVFGLRFAGLTMNRTAVATAIGIALAMFAVVPAGAADSAGKDGWQYDLAVYVWLPTIDGKLGFDIPGSGNTFEMDPGTILEDLQMTGMLGFEAHGGRWSAAADVIYLDLADQKEAGITLSIRRSLELDVGARLELTSWIAQTAGAYDVVRTKRARLGVLFGVRYFSMDTDLALRIDGPLPPELPTQNFSQKAELWDGIVGIKGHYGRRWYVPYYLDVGTGSSELTWQAMAGFGYRWHWGSVFATYRYLSFDEGDQEFVRGLSIRGPAVGVTFRF